MAVAVGHAEGGTAVLEHYGCVLVVFAVYCVAFLGRVFAHLFSANAQVADGVVEVHVEKRAVYSGNGVAVLGYLGGGGAVGPVGKGQACIALRQNLQNADVLVGIENLVVGELYAFIYNAVGYGVDFPASRHKAGGVVFFGNALVCGICARNAAESQ